MGSTLAQSAFLVAQRRPLGHAPMRLLLHMALKALDTSTDPQKPARRYFAGRQHQAAALGFPADDFESEAARSAVKRALRVLDSGRFIRRLEAGTFLRTSTYELQLRGDVPSELLLWEAAERRPVRVPVIQQGVGERPPVVPALAS